MLPMDKATSGGTRPTKAASALLLSLSPEINFPINSIQFNLMGRFDLWEKKGIFSHIMSAKIMSQSAQSQILARIRGNRRGWVFTPRHFLDLSVRKSADMALSRLVDAGTIRHLARGLYDYPKTHPKLGLLSPTPDAIAKAISEKDATRLQPSGAYAVNLLGLSQQVPSKIVYLTDGAEKSVEVGKQSIQLRHTTPKNMATAGTPSGLVIQAFRYLGKDGVDATHIDTLRRTLLKKDRAQLWKNRVHAPAWMHRHFEKIAGEEAP
jgi:hypothetical protein